VKKKEEGTVKEQVMRTRRNEEKIEVGGRGRKEKRRKVKG
jgi:hypothetical protein